MNVRYALAIGATTLVAAIPAAGWAANQPAAPQDHPCADAEWMQEHFGDMNEHWAEMEAFMGAGGMMGATSMPHHQDGSMPFRPVP